jgi:glycosyltransferase involved in cell wall biosynthesis
VVIPAHNEAANLPHVLSLLPRDVEVILVDGRSTDGTVAVTQALRPDATIIQQDRRGKGNALACGFAAATGDIVVALEADGSADPREIPLFVDALMHGADVAKARGSPRAATALTAPSCAPWAIAASAPWPPSCSAPAAPT